MDAVLRNFRLAARSFRRNPGFSAVAVLCLALGIGANSAIFSFVDAVLLRPADYREPERLVVVWNQFLARGPDKVFVSGHEFLDYRGETKTFERTAAVIGQLLNLTGGEPEMCRAARVSADLFPLLGVEPLLGRAFAPEEDAFGQNRVVVLSHAFWQRRFGGDPGAVGSTMILDGNPATVVGVMPPGFRVLNQTHDFWVPIAINLGNLPPREARGLTVLARLRPGVSLAAAQAEMSLLARRLQIAYPASYPAESGWGILLTPVVEELVGRARPMLVALSAAVGLVLLIACVNVASLLLARAVARRKELSIRAALGAGRAPLLGQLLAESLLLALAGAAAGLAFAFWAVRALLGMIPAASFPSLDRVGIDGRVLLFTLLVAVATGVLFGLAPAVQALGADVVAALKEGGKTSGGGAGRQPLRSALVVVEVALTLMVLVGAGLLVKSFARLSSVDPGFAADRLLTAPVYLSPLKYNQPEPIAAFYGGVLERVRALPGVVAAGAVSQLPVAGDDMVTEMFVEGRAGAPGDPPEQAGFRTATSGYFRAMEIPVLQGRDFGTMDTPESEPVVVVDELLARTYWPGESAVGKRLRLNEPGMEQWRTVVGVVGAVRHRVAAEAQPQLYLPSAQQPIILMFLALRTAGDPAALTPAVRAAVHEVDRDQPIDDVLPMAERIGRSLSRPRFATTLFGLFGATALLLTVIGVHGLIAYSVAQRTHEIGIRMSLGAGRREVVALVVRQGLLLVGAGIAIGLAGALAGSRLLEKLLYGVGTRDAATFIAVPLLLVLCGLLATGLPALRATRVPPITALRSE